MQAWEYKLFAIEVIENDASFEHSMNQLGADGWELVLCNTQPGSWLFLFKRPAGPRPYRP